MSIFEVVNSAECDADPDPTGTRPDGKGCDEFSDIEPDDDDWTGDD